MKLQIADPNVPTGSTQNLYWTGTSSRLIILVDDLDRLSSMPDLAMFGAEDVEPMVIGAMSPAKPTRYLVMTSGIGSVLDVEENLTAIGEVRFVSHTGQSGQLQPDSGPWHVDFFTVGRQTDAAVKYTGRETLDEGLLAKMERFHLGKPGFRRVPRAIADQMLDFAAIMTTGLYMPSVTATEDGGLVLEIRLSSSRQLFLELDRHGKADAILFEEEGHSFESLEARDMPGVVRALAERATGPI